MRGERSRRFPDVPLHRMQAVASVRNMSNPNVLARRQEVSHAFRNQRAERN